MLSETCRQRPTYLGHYYPHPGLLVPSVHLSYPHTDSPSSDYSSELLTYMWSSICVTDKYSLLKQHQDQTHDLPSPIWFSFAFFCKYHLSTPMHTRNHGAILASSSFQPPHPGYHRGLFILPPISFWFLLFTSTISILCKAAHISSMIPSIAF